MKDELFGDLLTSVKKAGAIRRGEQTAERTSHYRGKALVEMRERRETVWSLGQAAEQLEKS